MLWFTGSATEGLPFIHDSFPSNPKAVHHKPKLSRQPPHTDSGSSTARTTSSRDVNREVLDAAAFRLPAVDSGNVSSNGQLTSRGVERGEKGKEHSSFTSYMHRYKACARLKGISPSRAYCSTRMKPTPSDNDQDLSPTRFSPKDSHTSFVIPPSKLRMEPKADVPTPNSKNGEASTGDPPQILPQDSPVEVFGTQGCSALERQIEEKLKNDSCQDDGMMNHVRQHNTPRGRARRGRHGGGGVGKVHGGGRPLGDIVSPQRLQQLLSQEDDRTLPHTYYRISLDGKHSDNLDIEPPH